MSLTFHPNLLVDYAARTWATGEALFPSILNKEYRAIQTKIAQLNDAVQDVGSRHSGSSQPTTKIQGQFWADTGNDKLLLDTTGTGATQPVPRVLKVDITAVSLTAAGNLMTYTIPANTLKANGKILRITAWGTKTGTAATSQIDPQIGGVGIFSDPFSLGTNSDAWKIIVTIMRQSSNTQVIFGYCIASDSAGFDGSLAATAGGYSVAKASNTATDTSSIAFKFVLSTLVPPDSLAQEGMLVELLN